MGRFSVCNNEKWKHSLTLNSVSYIVPHSLLTIGYPMWSFELHNQIILQINIKGISIIVILFMLRLHKLLCSDYEPQL